MNLQQQLWYALTIATLAIVSGALLVYELWGGVEPETVVALQRIDFLVAGIFLFDFLLGLSFPPSTRSQYWKDNWLNFIASIPITSELSQLLRLLRLVRAVRVIRAGIEVRFTTMRYKNIKEQADTKQK